MGRSNLEEPCVWRRPGTGGGGDGSARPRQLLWAGPAGLSHRAAGLPVRVHGAAGREKLRSAASLRCGGGGLLKGASARGPPRDGARALSPAGRLPRGRRRAAEASRARGAAGEAEAGAGGGRSNAGPAAAALLPRPRAARLGRAQRRGAASLRCALQLRRRPSGGLLREGADGRAGRAQRLHPSAGYQYEQYHPVTRRCI